MSDNYHVWSLNKIMKVLRWAVIISMFGFAETHIDQILPKTKPDKEENIIIASKALAKSYELAIVSDKINNLDYLSNRTSNIIQTSMQEAAGKYKLPIILMHAIFKVESDYMYWVNHPTVRVMVNGRRIITNAIGLGGIMWCFWGDSLKANGIAETKSDLYMPDVNVMASAYVLRTLINDVAKNYPRLTKKNILSKVIKLYYGAYSRTYLRKMQRFTSKLWMEQVASLLIRDITKKGSDLQAASISMPIKVQNAESLIVQKEFNEFQSQ